MKDNLLPLKINLSEDPKYALLNLITFVITEVFVSEFAESAESAESAEFAELPYKFPPFKSFDISTFLENKHIPSITPSSSTLKESKTSNNIIPTLSSPSKASAKNPEAFITFSLSPPSVAFKTVVTIPTEVLCINLLTLAFSPSISGETLSPSPNDINFVFKFSALDDFK